MNMVCAMPVCDEIESLSNSLRRSGDSLQDDELPNATVLARLVAAQRTGHGCLPLHLGLEMNAFSAMIQRYFPGTLFWLALIGINILGVLCCLVGVLVTIPLTFAAITVAYQDIVGFEPRTMESL